MTWDCRIRHAQQCFLFSFACYYSFLTICMGPGHNPIWLFYRILALMTFSCWSAVKQQYTTRALIVLCGYPRVYSLVATGCELSRALGLHPCPVSDPLRRVEKPSSFNPLGVFRQNAEWHSVLCHDLCPPSFVRPSEIERFVYFKLWIEFLERGRGGRSLAPFWQLTHWKTTRSRFKTIFKDWKPYNSFICFRFISDVKFNASDKQDTVDKRSFQLP